MIQYSFFPTDPLLSEYIFSYGLMELGEGITAPLLSPPNGLTGFLIRTKYDARAEVVGKDFQGNPIARQLNYAIGQTTHPITGYGVGRFSILVVFFQPLGMYQLFGFDMPSLTDKSIDLADFLGIEKAAKLVHDLKTAEDIQTQVSVLNRFFLAQDLIKENMGMLKDSLRLIHESQGTVSIKKIEESLKINRRTLERHFMQRVGISPKNYAQIFRFKCAMNFLQANPDTTWAGLTYNNGFYDQAHLIRYFKEYLKVSPNNLVKLDTDFINYLLKH